MDCYGVLLENVNSRVDLNKQVILLAKFCDILFNNHIWLCFSWVSVWN